MPNVVAIAKWQGYLVPMPLNVIRVSINLGRTGCTIPFKCDIGKTVKYPCRFCLFNQNILEEREDSLLEWLKSVDDSRVAFARMGIWYGIEDPQDEQDDED